MINKYVLISSGPASLQILWSKFDVLQNIFLWVKMKLSVDIKAIIVATGRSLIGIKIKE